jgi:phosphate uptake regulator
MKRKVTLHGPATLSVSLPLKWARKYNVKKGDEVDVIEDGNNLIISEDSKKISKSIHIDFNNYEKRLIRLTLNNLYRQGYDNIKIYYDSLNQLKHIQESCTQLLPGFEIIKTGQGFCSIESILSPDQSKFDVLYRRAFLSIHEMMLHFKESLFKEEIDPEMVEAEHLKIEQYCNFCIRELLIAKDEKRFIELYTTLYLMMIPSTIKRLSKYIKENNITKIDPKIIKYFDQISDIYHELYDSYFKSDMEKLNLINSKIEKMIIEEVSNKQIIITNYLSQIVRFMLILISPFTMNVHKISHEDML